MDGNEFVVVKCNKCGKEWSFCPMRVIVTHACDCGNDDYGNPKHWESYEFGNFTYLRSEWLKFDLSIGSLL